MVNLCLKCIIIISSVTWNNCDIVLAIFWSNIYDCLNVLVVKTLHSFHSKKNLVPSHTGLKIEVHVCDHKVENCCFRMKLCLSIHKYCVHGLVLQVFKIKKWLQYRKDTRLFVEECLRYTKIWISLILVMYGMKHHFTRFK